MACEMVCGRKMQKNESNKQRMEDKHIKKVTVNSNWTNDTSGKTMSTDKTKRIEAIFHKYRNRELIFIFGMFRCRRISPTFGAVECVIAMFICLDKEYY